MSSSRANIALAPQAGQHAPSSQSEIAALAAAIATFEATLPGWWYSVCKCSVSSDASCAPDRQWQDAHLLEDRTYDNGFHVDLHHIPGEPLATMAEALMEVMADALAQLKKDGHRE